MLCLAGVLILACSLSQLPIPAIPTLPPLVTPLTFPTSTASPLIPPTYTLTPTLIGQKPSPVPTDTPIVVHITGAVPRPGVYALPKGARVQDGISAAGGFLAEAEKSGINLARALEDGEQLDVPFIAGFSPVIATPVETFIPSSDLININAVPQSGRGVFIAVLDTGLVPNWRDYFPEARIATELGTGFDQPVTFKGKSNNPCEVDVWAVGAQHRGQFLGAGLRFQTHHPDAVKLLISSGYAPKAYAYLFIVEGEGVLSVILTRNFANARSYLQRSLEFFRQVSPFDMENVRLSSGFGGHRNDFWQSETKPLRVGEAAGFQDYLWGFGIRYALHSGYLAAQSIAHGSDYHQAVRTHIHPLIYTSLLNRAVYNRAGDGTYRVLIELFSKSPHLIDLLARRYRASILGQLLGLLRQAQPIRSFEKSVDEN